jgi:hypothetical protein
MTMKIQKSEAGAMVVEASIVVPVMFFMIILLFFLGNAYYAKCKVENVTGENAINAAAFIADPLLRTVTETGSLPDKSKSNPNRPNRYLLEFAPGGSAEQKKLGGTIKERLEALGTGFFTGMAPKRFDSDVTYHNIGVYQSLRAGGEVLTPIPFKILGQKERYQLTYSSYADVPVCDAPEFIRNVSMVRDLSERSGVCQEVKDKIGKMVSTAKSFFSKGGENK